MLFILIVATGQHLVMVVIIVFILLVTVILLIIIIAMQVMHMKMRQMDKINKHFYQDNTNSLL
jgi:hypothetical protein